MPVVESQRRMVRSSEPEAMYLPSGEKATDLTQSVWPCSGGKCFRFDAMFHIRIVLSLEPDAMRTS